MVPRARRKAHRRLDIGNCGFVVRQVGELRHSFDGVAISNRAVFMEFLFTSGGHLISHKHKSIAVSKTSGRYKTHRSVAIQLNLYTARSYPTICYSSLKRNSFSTTNRG